MHYTRPWFRGYSTLARIVDNNNTIENNRKKKKPVKSNIIDENDFYMIGKNYYFPKELIDNFAKTGDITEILEYRVNNIHMRGVLDIEKLRNELIYNKIFTSYIAVIAKMFVNIFVDENKHNDWKINEFNKDTKYGLLYSYNGFLSIFKSNFLKNEINERRKK